MKLITGTPRNGLILDDLQLDELRWNPETLSDPVLRETLRALDNPTRELIVNIAGTRGPRRLAFSVGETLTAVSMAQPDKPAELAAVTTDSVPSIIARAVGLGPAQYVDEPVSKVPAADIESLTAQPAAISKTLDALPIGRMLRSNAWQVWSVQASMLHADRDVSGFRLDVIGATGDGWWTLDAGRRKVAIERTRALTVWAQLCSLITEIPGA